MATQDPKSKAKKATEKATESAEKTTESATQAMEKATEAVKEGAFDAGKAVSNVIPAIGRFCSKTVYGTFYYLSYGVVFSSLTIAHLVPLDNAMGEGLHDGTAAAKKAVKKHEAKRAAEQTEATAQA